jgi:hypothetical protein
MNTWREGLAWAAGFYDGEGSTTAPMVEGVYHWRVNITQVSREVLDRFAAAVGAGRVYGPYPTKHRPRFMYVATGGEAMSVIAKMWTWLGTVKREQASAAAGVVKTTAARTRPGLRPTCRRGHPLDEKNTHFYVQGKGSWRSRNCRRCRADAVARSRHKRRLVAALLEA